MSELSADSNNPRRTRQLVGLYCVLWLVEGLFRKWILPQYSQQLLLIRDPVVLLIYLIAWREGVFPNNGWIRFLSVYAIFSLFQAVFQAFGGVPLVIAAFGFRTLFLHLPLIWIIPRVLSEAQVRTVAYWVMLIAPFLAALMVAQFGVGAGHWLNAATIEGGTQIGSVGERIRPAAIFSFITGPIHYFALCTACVFAGFLTPRLFPKWLLGLNVCSILIAMSVSGSRTLVLGCMVVAAFGVLAASRRGAGVFRLFLGVAIIFTAYFSLSRLIFFQVGGAVFNERWAGSRESEERSVYARYLGTFASGFEWSTRVPVFGYGIGMSSNLAVLKFGMEVPIETEWERVVYEIGPISALPYLGFRVAVAASLMLLGFRALRTGNYFCLLFAAACSLDFLTGNFRQVTTHGFASICAGLCLASGTWSQRLSSSSEPESETPPTRPVARVVRGRGPLSIGG